MAMSNVKMFSFLVWILACFARSSQSNELKIDDKMGDFHVVDFANVLYDLVKSIKNDSALLQSDMQEMFVQVAYGRVSSSIKQKNRWFFYNSVVAIMDSYANVKRYMSDARRVPEPCELKPECTCSKDRNERFMHCEGTVHAYKRKELISFDCNATVSIESLSVDHRSFLESDGSDSLIVHVSGCPQPKGSYGLLLFSNPPNDDSAGPKTSPIRSLYISCGERKNFSLSTENFEGLKSLMYAYVNCPVLSDLPSDAFHGTPSILSLHIGNTRIEHLRTELFDNMAFLLTLDLKNNRIATIQKGAFQGLGSLFYLDLSLNKLKFLEDNLFGPLKDLMYLLVSRNNLTVLPKDISSLPNLRYLYVANNRINEMKREYCTGSNNLTDFGLENNKMKSIDASCFLKSTKIDVSGNSLSKITDQPVVADSLEHLKFNDNSNTNRHLEKFLISKTLISLEVRNSSIHSLDPDVLHDVPNLEEVDLSQNSISGIHQNFFMHNPHLVKIQLQQNNLLALPETLFQYSAELQILNVSRNDLRNVSLALLGSNRNLLHFDLSGNLIEDIPALFLSNLTSLRSMTLSGNRLRILDYRFFRGMVNLRSINLSYNKLDRLPRDIFLPIKDDGKLENLHLKDNLLSSLPILKLPNLKHLNLEDNRMEELREGVFHFLPNLKALYLSNNRISKLPDSPLVTYGQGLIILDLSLNMLQNVPKNMLREARRLSYLNLAGNQISSFFLETIRSAKTLIFIDLSYNNISFFGFENSDLGHFNLDFPAKYLLLSNNRLSFDYSPTMFDEITATWGKVSSFVHFPEIEELHLYNNSITTMFMDWRNMLPNLRILDLRRNKFRFLTHQDMLFSSVKIQADGKVEPYYSLHSLSVDLRENEIRGLELPSSMLIERPSDCEGKGLYSHATIFLDRNPFICGCGMMNLLRVLNRDVVLTSELYRTTGKGWILAAKLDPGNLSCWEPTTVRGKKINEPEKWIHHLLPMAGLCAIRGYPGSSKT